MKSACCIPLVVTLLVSALWSADASAQSAATWGITFPTSHTGVEQQHFLEGVTAMHLHMFEDAGEHFQAAQRLAPDFAMAYWGEALNQHRTIWSIHNLEEARSVLRRLGATPEERAATATTAREKGYLAAVEELFGEGTQREREAAYSEAMRELSEAYPTDTEARAWYALSLMRVTPPGLTREQTRTRMASLALRVLQDNPLHPGGNRYLIQSTDDPENSALGFVAVENLRGVEATAAEALHIPSHVHIQQGMWPEAAESNMRAFEASMAWVDEHGWSLEDLNNHNYGHLIQFAHYAYLQAGQLAEAEAIRQRVRTDFEESGHAGAIRTPLSDTHARSVVDLAHWKDARMLAEMAQRDGIRDAGMWLAIGIAAARSDDLELAREALAVLSGTTGGPASLAAVSAKQVAGLIHLAEGDVDRALGELSEATRINWERPVTRIGVPPRPLKPVIELYGEALLEVGQTQKALDQFELGLTVFRGRTGLLMGAAQASRELGRIEDAQGYYRALADIWADADEGHPFAAEIRKNAMR